MSRLSAIFISFALVLPIMTGCASKYGEQKTVVNYYHACYAPIKDLRDHEHDVAKGTAVGGVVGALGGALVGLLATGKVEGAVMGAAAGGATGLVAGNIYASKQKEADDNVRLASYLQDLDGDISNLDATGAAARSSLQCYDKQFNSLVASIKSRSIAREAAQARFAEIMSGREEATKILGQVVYNARDLAQQYEQAFVQEEKAIQSPQKASQGQAVLKARKKAINNGRSKATQLVKKEKEWQQYKEVSSNETVRQQNEVSALMADYYNATM